MTVLIFSACTRDDLKQIMDGGETNHMTTTLNVYLDVHKVIAWLLNVLTAPGDELD